MSTSISQTLPLNTRVSTQTFGNIQQIIQSQTTKASQQAYKTIQDASNILQRALSYIAKKQLQKFNAIAKQFTNFLAQNKQIYLNHQFLCEIFNQIKLMVCKNNKLFHIGKPNQQLRGFVIIGKAVNIYKKKKNQDDAEHKQQRDQLCALIQQGTIRLFQDGKYILNKNEKNYTLDDILLHHDLADSTLQEINIGNEVFSPFIPLQKTIVMVIPSKTPKPECLNFVKSSLLHTYVGQVNAISKIISKQVFYKNSVLKGIYFIDEGQVQVKSGRVIARGWTTFGKCKTSGFGWRFKPVPFIRFVAKNAAIWKQFFNDIQLNNQYPFNIVNLLGLNEDEDFTSSSEWKLLGKKKTGGGGSKSLQLPRLNIGNKFFNEEKLQEIQRLRHYDDRINDIFSYKQDLLVRKLKGNINKKFQPIFRQENAQQQVQKRKKYILQRLNSRSSISKKDLSIDGPPTENILIMSVLKRLQSMVDMNENPPKKQLTLRHQYSNHRQRYLLSDSNSKRQNVKILPMQLHQRAKAIKRNKRF